MNKLVVQEFFDQKLFLRLFRLKDIDFNNREAIDSHLKELENLKPNSIKEKIVAWDRMGILYDYKSMKRFPNLQEHIKHGIENRCQILNLLQDKESIPLEMQDSIIQYQRDIQIRFAFYLRITNRLKASISLYHQILQSYFQSISLPQSTKQVPSTIYDELEQVLHKNGLFLVRFRIEQFMQSDKGMFMINQSREDIIRFMALYNGLYLCFVQLDDGIDSLNKAVDCFAYQYILARIHNLDLKWIEPSIQTLFKVRFQV